MIGARVELDLSPAENLARSGLRKAARIGLNRAASPVKRSVVSHANAVKRYGFLAKSIRIKLRNYPADRFVSVVGPTMNYVRTKGKYKRGAKKGEKKRHRPAFYAHLIERGTKTSRARPWLAPAHAETAREFLRRAEREVGKEIELALKRRTVRVRAK